MNIQKKLSFLLVYLLIPLPFLGVLAGGWYVFLPFVVLFALVPLIDALFLDTRNPTDEEEEELHHHVFFKFIVYLYVPIQIIMIACGVFIVSRWRLSWYEWIGFTTSLGLVTGGAGINLAHEMMHKHNRLDQFLSKVLLVTVCYGHFIIEHVKGHHVRVATPEDPATAQLGDSLYRYLPKTLWGSLTSAFHLETLRLHQRCISLWHIQNQFWWIISVPILIAASCYIYGGFSALAFFLVQSSIAILTLEIVNYIEHYGLERKKLPDGGYEKVTPYHSWNASHWLSNTLLFHLQRHSDHHTHGAKPYQILRHLEQAPQLPSGYFGMFVLALIPPLWRNVMDKRVIFMQKRAHKDDTT